MLIDPVVRRVRSTGPGRAIAAWASSTRFGSSASYWERRYRTGGNSGSGSSGRLAHYKATFLNDFVRVHEVRSVVEFGCGDGSQLMLAEYPRYLGLDSSATAVRRCLDQFAGDRRLSFVCCEPAAMSLHTGLFSAELAVSVDVIYHLVEDDVFHSYMAHLFDSAERFVVICSSNWESVDAAHVRHRHFTRWVNEHAPEWVLVQSHDPPYPYDPNDPTETSWASFFVFER